MDTPTALSYQETLETIGGVLDAAGCTLAVIALSPGGLRLSADVARVREDWSLAALAEESQRRREQEAGEPEALVALLSYLSDEDVLSAPADTAGPQPTDRYRLCGTNVLLDAPPG